MLRPPLRRGALAVVVLAASLVSLSPVGALAPRSTLDHYRGLPATLAAMRNITSGTSLNQLPSALLGQLANEDHTTYFANCQATSGPSVCAYDQRGATSTLVILGDSFSQQFIPALKILGNLHHFRIVAFMHNSCNVAVINTFSTATNGLDPTCAPFRNAAIASINKMSPQPALVVISEKRYWFTPQHQPITTTEWAQAVTKLLNSITSHQKVVIFGEATAFLQPSGCLATNSGSIKACNTPLSSQNPVSTLGVPGISAGRAYPLGVRMLECTAVTCPDVSNNVLVHSDRYHMASAYSAAVSGSLGELIGCAAWAGFRDKVTVSLLGTLTSAKAASCSYFTSSLGQP